MVRYVSPEDDPSTVLVWISRSSQLPDICCTCGMFTVDRIKVKYVETVPASEENKVSFWGVIHFLVILFGGPIGWLFALTAAQNKDDDGQLVNKNVKIKVPQCILCRGEIKPQVVASAYEQGQYQFWVHPLFAERFATENAELLTE